VFLFSRAIASVFDLMLLLLDQALVLFFVILVTPFSPVCSLVFSSSRPESQSPLRPGCRLGSAGSSSVFPL
jgi:hypothetical protein